MTYKHLAIIALLVVLMVPTLSYAENAVRSAKAEKDPAIAANSLTEEQKDKNRKERIDHALNALEQNINVVDKSIKQSLVRLSGIDKNDKDFNQIKDDISKAEALVSQADKAVEEARTAVKTMDTTNKDDIQKMKDRISEAKKLTHDSISFIKKAVTKLKVVKLTTHAALPTAPKQ